MKNLANFLLFQVGWFACVGAAANGSMWLGPLVAVVIVALHLRLVSQPGERRRELGTILLVSLGGMLIDSSLGLSGATRYPTSEAAWHSAIVPPWITALWALFATLPHHSLAWLRGRPFLAATLGAAGGPLAFLAGSRMGAVAVGDPPLLTWTALALEYAIVTPLLIRLPRRSA